jgi:DNA invertase Pin-like site-specific DNA recombinase
MNTFTAAYLRVSSKDQRHDSQMRELKRYCQQRGWRKVEFFADKISGAKSTRPELERMFKELRSGRVERVVAFTLDRLGRSVTHLCLLVDELARMGIPLICPSQGIDTSEGSTCGKFQLDVLKAVCEFERNLIRDRVNSGLAAARERGVRLGRPSKPHKRSAEVLALKAKGMGLRAISRKLGLAASTVHSILNRPKAEG